MKECPHGQPNRQVCQFCQDERVYDMASKIYIQAIPDLQESGLNEADVKGAARGAVQLARMFHSIWKEYSL